MSKVTILKRSQRAYKGWTGHYRRRIDALADALIEIATTIPSGDDYASAYAALRAIAKIALEEHKHE